MVRVPRAILDKPGTLDARERVLMRAHVARGLELLDAAGAVAPAVVQYVAQHHERADGGGYPRGLKAAALSPAGLIAAIVDVYDALGSERGYGAARPADETIKCLYDGGDRDFHAPLVEALGRALGAYPIGSLVELSSGDVGVVVSVDGTDRLRPRVLLCAAGAAAAGEPRVIDLTAAPQAAGGAAIGVRRLLPAGSNGIDPIARLAAFVHGPARETPRAAR
jgi:HD-GYP domain-containing protein (c-di-GMP phosphodiesterase class II)